MEILLESSEDSCSVLTRNNTMHMAKLATGILGYIEIPVTTVKQSHCISIDINTLIQLVFHTYQIELTEPNIVHYQDMKKINRSFEVNHSNLYKDPILNNTVYNV